MSAKYESSTKWATPGIKENRFITSSLQDTLEPDSKNTDWPIKTVEVDLLSLRFQDWLGIIKSPSCESLRLFRLSEWILETKMWKIVLVCKTYKNDVIRLKLCHNVDLVTPYNCVSRKHSPCFRTWAVKKKNSSGLQNTQNARKKLETCWKWFGLVWSFQKCKRFASYASGMTIGSIP